MTPAGTAYPEIRGAHQRSKNAPLAHANVLALLAAARDDGDESIDDARVELCAAAGA